jgi:hypothetical protein
MLRLGGPVAAALAPGSSGRAGRQLSSAPRAATARRPVYPAPPQNQFGLNISDNTGLVGLDLDNGPWKLGYDVKRQVGTGRAGAARRRAQQAAAARSGARRRLLQAGAAEPGAAGRATRPAVSRAAHPGPPCPPGFHRSSQDLAFQYTHKGNGSTVKVRQVVPQLKWEVVPTPVVEVRRGAGCAWCWGGGRGRGPLAWPGHRRGEEHRHAACQRCGG